LFFRNGALLWLFKHWGIIGADTMGNGISHVFARQEKIRETQKSGTLKTNNAYPRQIFVI
jgi:hypothetical protein